MKKITIFLISVLISGITFGQMKNKPKVVVLILGTINPTLNEKNFPDLQIYYIPELEINKPSGVSKSTNKNAWSSALGMGRTAHTESHNTYTGKLHALVEKGVSSGTVYIFDKNGLINAKSFSGKQLDFNNQTKFLVKFNKMKRNWESETFSSLMKSLVKKGNTIKPRKKPKKPLKRYTIGCSIDNFEVTDKTGNKYPIQNLIKGNPATLLLFLYVNPYYNFNKGKESGTGKKGKVYMNEVAQVIAANKQIKPLSNLEEGIFGKKINQ